MRNLPTSSLSRLLSCERDCAATGVRNDAVLVPCKAAGFGWETVEIILRKRLPSQPASPQVLKLAANDYQRLSVETAQKTLRFLQVRATVK